jgi:MFS superfamily sulfate permease-like transporter
VLIALTGYLQYLPRCVLAGVVFTIAIGMIDVKGLKDILSESRGEFLLALSTAVVVPGIGVEQGILFAIAVSLVRHVRHSYHPHTMVLFPDPEGGWLTKPAEPGQQTWRGLILYRFGADLFYANADRFADETRALVAGAPDPVRWFVVDAGAITDMDYSAARTLRDLLRELTARAVNVAFGRVEPSLRSDMERHGVAAILGEGRIYASLHQALALVGKSGTAAEGGDGTQADAAGPVSPAPP